MPEFRASVSDAEKRRLTEFISALRTPCKANIAPDSAWLNSDFESEFRSKLLAHHCFIGSPLFQESFDSAFLAGCEAAGLEVEFAPPGTRFWDIRVAGRSLSLKSSKAKSLRETVLHVSKLTEAAWIQDCRTAAKRSEKTKQLFTEYCNQVDAIIQLRYFAKKDRYEIVEVPTTLFEPILALPKKHFAADGPTINIPVGTIPPHFTLKLDRSDAKVTVANIDKHQCVVHGSWQL